MTHNLTSAVNLIDWSSDKNGNGRRPQIAARLGTRVKVRKESTEYGDVYTVYVRRRGKFWSNTRLVKKDGSVLRNYMSIEYHKKLS